MENKDKEFFKRFADLLNEFEVDIDVEMNHSYDGEYFESLDFSDMHGRVIGSFSHKNIHKDDVRDYVNKIKD